MCNWVRFCWKLTVPTSFQIGNVSRLVGQRKGVELPVLICRAFANTRELYKSNYCSFYITGSLLNAFLAITVLFLAIYSKKPPIVNYYYVSYVYF